MKQPLSISFEIDETAKPVDFDLALARFLLAYVRRLNAEDGDGPDESSKEKDKYGM